MTGSHIHIDASIYMYLHVSKCRYQPLTGDLRVERQKYEGVLNGNNCVAEWEGRCKA